MTLTRPLKATLLATALILAPASVPMAVAASSLGLQSFAPLVETVKPAVVTVRTEGRSARQNTQMPQELERFFRNTPGQPDNTPRPTQGVGSGFIIDESGIIVTNNHVVEEADTITVILDDGTEYRAELIGRDTRVDIAVLRVEATGLPTVAWGDSDTVRVGDWAMAIGNPLGLEGTVTTGIISARGRDINSGPYDDYLQVDAAINRGNSGGPLLDLNGQVIGVNTAIISPTGGNVGLGFAIPAAQAQQIVADLIDDGQVERGWIGVSIQPMTSDIAASLGLVSTDGALVAEVITDSPAQTAGLRPGDVILGFNDRPIGEVRGLPRAGAASTIGNDAQIDVWRQGQIQKLTIAPGLLETATLAATPAQIPAVLSVPGLGFSVETTPDNRLAIRRIDPNTPAEASGLRPGDLILSANQAEVTDADMLGPVNTIVFV